MTNATHTPGPWVVHGAFYTHGVKGDVFAKDAKDVFDATPVCRVVAPVSHRQTKKGGPIDALHAIAKRKQQAPVIEANARLIAAAPELLEALDGVLAKYTGLVESGDAGFWDAEKEPEVIAARAAIAKAKGGAA
ncbi:hypothetical protein [Sphingobium yanoikuyae]|jgi:hypothetical protein|uniref:hypothetical protein n=1 Tax=Sphingobium yanoikuyae TaxID=13690 RepID=UPI0007C7ED2C|nr:hypothetical protein [Sphingobium yanoikuyae]